MPHFMPFLGVFKAVLVGGIYTVYIIFCHSMNVSKYAENKGDTNNNYNYTSQGASAPYLQLVFTPIILNQNCYINGLGDMV